jgi:hypothetical protein
MGILFSLAFVSFILFLCCFWIWMLIDCVTKESDTGNKLVWALIILFSHIIGALAYYFIVRRPRRFAESLPPHIQQIAQRNSREGRTFAP